MFLRGKRKTVSKRGEMSDSSCKFALSRFSNRRTMCDSVILFRILSMIWFLKANGANIFLIGRLCRSTVESKEM
jgi:hypothetical protein